MQAISIPLYIFGETVCHPISRSNPCGIYTFPIKRWTFTREELYIFQLFFISAFFVIDRLGPNP